MAINWDETAEYVATAVDPRGIGLWLVELGAGRTVLASVHPSAGGGIERLAPGDCVRIRFRSGTKTPRIPGYSDVDRAGNPVDPK
jgi:hypothetical protein